MTQTTPTLSVEDKLILLKIYEDRIKALKSSLQAEIACDTSKSTPYGKVTLTAASRVTIDGALLYNKLQQQGVDPMLFGECSVKVDEATLSRLVSLGYISTDDVSVYFKETRYETLRVTVNANKRDDLLEIAHSSRLLLEHNDE